MLWSRSRCVCVAYPLPIRLRLQLTPTLADLRRARPFRYIEPSLAKQVAEGDACPISLLPMEDINPGFVPRALKTIPMNSAPTSVARPDKGKGKAKEPPSEKPSSVSLLKFFCKSALRSLRRPWPCRSPARSPFVLPASCFLGLRVAELPPQPHGWCKGEKHLPRPKARQRRALGGPRA